MGSDHHISHRRRHHLRKRCYEILEKGGPEDTASRVFDWFIIALIALNILAVILETVASLRQAYHVQFAWFERVSIVIFTVEYLLRLWSCTTNPRYGRAVVGRLRFARSPMAIIDLAAILPFYLPMLIPIDLRFLRALRLFRLFRLLKVARYSESLQLFGRVLRATKEQLVVTAFVASILLVLASSLMYYVEHETQPDSFSSIPAAMWWGVATLTTVGYGDVYPVTAFGKFCGAAIAVLGVATFALPAGIIASAFIGELQKKRQRMTCPHCGRSLEHDA